MEKNPDRMPYYTGRIIPTPRKVSYRDEFLSLKEGAVLPGKGLETDGAYVKLLRKRIEQHGGELQVVESPVAGSGALTIILGDHPVAESFLEGREVPEQEQGYLVHTAKANGGNIVVLKGRDRLGLLWAVSSFNQLVHIREGNPVVRAAEIVDYPSIPDRGFICDYWSRGPEYCLAFKFNKPVFCLALTERKTSWRLPLTEAVKARIQHMGETLSPFGIEWYAGMSPIRGDPESKIRSKNDDDFNLVLQRAERLGEAGGNLCLLYDDHRFPVSADDDRDFGTARQADVHFLNRLSQALKKQYPEMKILFSPPFYWGPTSPALYPEPRDDYLRAIGQLPDNVRIVWTGPQVRSGKVTSDEVEWITQRIRRKPVFWHNGVGPHMFTYHYVTDPVRIFEESYYDGFFRQVETYLFNCMMPNYAAGAITSSDYCWNPEAYDARRSVGEAATQLVGTETYPALVALNGALSYFDPFGLRRTPGAAKKLPEMKEKLAAVNAAWKEVERGNIAAVRNWTGMRNHVNQVNRFYQQLLESPNLALYTKGAEQSQKRAEKEATFSEKTDIFLSAFDFAGGAGPAQYANRCEKRLATWIFGRHSPNASMEAAFRVEPFPPDSDYQLTVSAQDDDAEAKCGIRILVNDTKIFEGANPFVRFGWSRQTYRIPAAALSSQNRLRIENVEDTGETGAPPYFMLNYAVVRKHKEE